MFYICRNFKELYHYQMKFTKTIYLLWAMLLSIPVLGQRHELGVRGGLSSILGDVGSTSYIQRPRLNNISEQGLPIYFGVMYRMNFNPYQTLRFDFGYRQMPFNDAYAKEQYRQNRRKYGTNEGLDANILFEYNFFPVNNEQKGMLSPYIFGGLGASLYNVRQVALEDQSDINDLFPMLSDGNGNYYATESFTNKFILSTPFGIGLKYKFNYNWAISAEAMFRPMFSDAVDYSVIDKKNVKITYNKNNTTYADTNTRKSYTDDAQIQVNEYLEQRNFGNKNSNDWVNSFTLGLTYSFGRPPCYCDQ